jgi:hypothetical protein
VVRLGETELKKLLQGGEMDTVKLKVAASRSVEMADVYAAWPMPAVALVFVSVFPKRMTFFPWSMRDFEPFPSIDTTFQDGGYVPNSPTYPPSYRTFYSCSSHRSL